MSFLTVYFHVRDPCSSLQQAGTAASQETSAMTQVKIGSCPCFKSNEGLDLQDEFWQESNNFQSLHSSIALFFCFQPVALMSGKQKSHLAFVVNLHLGYVLCLGSLNQRYSDTIQCVSQVGIFPELQTKIGMFAL